MTTHVNDTGCNLSREDFLPGDGPCVDGGTRNDHPSTTEWPTGAEVVTVVRIAHEAHDIEAIHADIDTLTAQWADKVESVTMEVRS